MEHEYTELSKDQKEYLQADKIRDLRMQIICDNLTAEDVITCIQENQLKLGIAFLRLMILSNNETLNQMKG